MRQNRVSDNHATKLTIFPETGNPGIAPDIAVMSGHGSDVGRPSDKVESVAGGKDNA